MVDESFVAKSRRQVLSLKTSLIKRCVPKNIKLYTRNATKFHLGDHISGPVREEILKVLLMPKYVSPDSNKKELATLMRALPQLLSNWTKELNLDNLIDLSPPGECRWNVLKLLRLIALHAPNIESLTLRNFKGSLGKKTADCLTEMKQLKCISLDASIIHWRAFVLVCSSLPALRELNFAQYDTSIRSIHLKEIKKDLPRVSHLRTLKCNRMFIRTRRVLEKHLPHLDLVVKGIPTLPSMYDECKGQPSSERTFLSRQFHEHLTNQDLHVKYPNITHFKINFHKTCHVRHATLHEYLPNFQKLEALSLEDMCFPVVYYSLSKYGENLRSLRLIGLRGVPKLSLNRILEMCPKLEELDLDQIRVENSEPIENFSELKKLTWTSTSRLL
ncbi:Hypothetical predicted protein [Cloeon dipterum]|uniref:Uncharacterized protein n=1 Tax=Cloeon dipterum TaxID=197152 RepID=A0A8S1DPM1_9INSE|nr:Hypothetical predicted protein [Cloeon dipterum]